MGSLCLRFDPRPRIRPCAYGPTVWFLWLHRALRYGRPSDWQQSSAAPLAAHFRVFCWTFGRFYPIRNIFSIFNLFGPLPLASMDALHSDNGGVHDPDQPLLGTGELTA